MKRFLCLCVCLCLLLSGCGEQTADTKNALADRVTLTLWIPTEKPAGADPVLEQANALLKEKLNTQVEFVFLEPQMFLASGQKADILSLHQSLFLDMVSQEQLAPLEDISYPGMAFSVYYRQEAWDAVQFQGHCYGIPMRDVFVSAAGVMLENQLLRSWGEIPPLETAQDWTALLQRAKEAGAVPLTQGMASYFSPKVMALDEAFGIDEYGKAVSLWEHRRDGVELMAQWRQQGLLQEEGEAFAVPTENVLYTTGDRTAVPIGSQTLTRIAVQQAVFGVGAESQEKLRAVYVIRALIALPELCNLLSFGLEGRDYERDALHPDRILPKDGYRLDSSRVGGQLLTYVLPGMRDDIWQMAEAQNWSATAEKDSSFSFFSTQESYRTIRQLAREYAPALQNGQLELLDDYQSKAEQAGLQSVLQEIQNQYDAYKK